MDQTELAARLTDVSREERAALLSEHVNSPGLELARAIKAIFDAHESSDPARAIAAAAALADLAQHSSDPHIDALAAWTSGMAAQLEGRIEDSLGLLRSAEDRYESLGQPRAAADVRISTLIALAILGRYDEAIATGLAARDVFLTHHDLLATGKIEQNIGNIHFLREQYPQAEAFYRAARERYLALEDQKQLAQIENVLGNVLVQRHQFQAGAAARRPCGAGDHGGRGRMQYRLSGAVAGPLRSGTGLPGAIAAQVCRTRHAARDRDA
jgi:tetratricopeptide (TPR) repeat protein